MCTSSKKMHFIDMGSGFPLLLGHSYLFDSNMWQPQLSALSKYYRVIVPDLWGHGSSPELPGKYHDLKRIAKDHLKLMDSLGIKEFGIIGLSVGGMWGAELAASYPKRVKCIALLDTFIGDETEAAYQNYFNMLNAVDKAGAIQPPYLEYAARQFFSDNVSDELLIPVINRLRSIPAERLRKSVVPIGKLIFGRPDRLSLLKKIKMPSVVITGELDKPRPTWEGAYMASRLGCNHVIIPGAGHISNQENPSAVTDALMTFLGEVFPN